MGFFAEEETLRGEVLRVVFANPDTGYAVLRIRPESDKAKPKAKEEITVVGDLVSLTAGRLAEFNGKYEEHAEFGRQFRAKNFREILPSTQSGLIRYLGSGSIPGIGVKLATILVDYFGDETINVLNHSSKRLYEVPGFGKKKVEAIKAAWEESAAKRDNFIFLQGLGVTPLAADKLYKQYGAKTAELVNSNPYRLADEVKGIGFAKADEIAMSLGIAPNSVERLAAGAVYAMNQMISGGHTCCPGEVFVKKCMELLVQPEPEVKLGIERALKSCLLVKYEECYYSLPLAQAEFELPQRVVNLAAAKKFAARAIRPDGNGKINLSDEQLLAIESVALHPLNIITGGPGVGKTTVVAEIVRLAHKAKLKIALAAPTGRAAKRLSESTGETAKTLHRLLAFDPGTGRFSYDGATPLGVDLLIVDELSMLDLMLANSLFRAVKPGTSVVLLGDPDQLPSVGAGTVLKSFLESGVFKVTELQKVFRQGKGSLIIENAHRVNHGQLPQKPEKNGALEDFYWIEESDPEKAVSLIERLFLERIPERFHLNYAEDIQILSPMNKGFCGCVALNGRIQNLVNSPSECRPEIKIGERIFRQGDKVMQISNNYDKNVFNGDIGRIWRIMPKDRKFLVDFGESGIIEYDYDSIDELVLAYAVTVHKSQGSEFPAVIVVLSNQHYVMLQRNLLYTAMTRARKLLVLIGGASTVKMAIDNVNTEVRYSNLKRFLIRKRKEMIEKAAHRE